MYCSLNATSQTTSGHSIQLVFDWCCTDNSPNLSVPAFKMLLIISNWSDCVFELWETPAIFLLPLGVHRECSGSFPSMGSARSSTRICHWIPGNKSSCWDIFVWTEFSTIKGVLQYWKKWTTSNSPIIRSMFMQNINMLLKPVTPRIAGFFLFLQEVFVQYYYVCIDISN